MNLTLKDALLSGGGALMGGIVGSATKPHYEDIRTGGANRTAVYADVTAGRTILGAVVGAVIGGLIAGLTTTLEAPATLSGLPPKHIG